MEVPKIFESEYRFCLIVWEKEPVNSGKLVELARERLGWTKATTYTVIRRLCQRGVLKNENGYQTRQLRTPINTLNGKNTSASRWMCFSVCPAMAPGTDSRVWFPVPPADRN